MIKPKISIYSFLLLVCLAITGKSFAQSYHLVWSEEFNDSHLDSSVWNIEQQIGVWNTGSNQELEHYSAANVTLGDDGSGNQCLILEAREESYNGYSFTSGRINTKGKFAYKNGKIEARIKMPDLANGLWPALWHLGYNDMSWPSCGEIDISEMGHAAGIIQGVPNRYYGAALHWENNDQHASYSTVSTASQAFNADYHIFTMEWTDGSISMFLDNSPTAYYTMNIGGADLEEFQLNPMYLVTNLAVGGQFTGITSNAGITAPLPARMYIDYIRIYQIEGEENLLLNPPLFTDFGVFSEENLFAGLDIPYDGTIIASQLTNSVYSGPAGGEEVLSFTADGNIDLKIQAVKPRNMQNFTENGALIFYIKTNIAEDITISVADSNGSSVQIILNDDFPDNPTRDDTWNRLAIPFSDFTGSIDSSAIKDLFHITANTSSGQNLAIDEVKWVAHVLSGDVYGIYTENPNITEKFIINNSTGHLYIWENTMAPLSGITPYEGTGVLAFRSQGSAGWYGFGLFSSSPLDFTRFSDGYLHLSLKTSSSQEFWLGMEGGIDTEARLTFNAASDPYGFVRDNEWHVLNISVSDMTGLGLDLSSCGNIFMSGGTTISDIAFDDIYFSNAALPLENPLINTSTDINNTRFPENIGDNIRPICFPNPTTGIVYLRGFTYPIRIKVVNNIGEVIAFQTVNKTDAGLDLSSLKSGFYRLQIIETVSTVVYPLLLIK